LWSRNLNVFKRGFGSIRFVRTLTLSQLAAHLHCPNRPPACRPQWSKFDESTTQFTLEAAYASGASSCMVRLRQSGQGQTWRVDLVKMRCTPVAAIVGTTTGPRQLRQ
jgi:hypothetical protein